MSKKTEVKRVAVYGLRRSGNHAILDWMIKNFSGLNNCYRVSHYLTASGNSCYINSLTERPLSALAVDHAFAVSNFTNIIATYEDVPSSYVTDFTLGYKRVAIVRDIVNIVASRLKLLENLRNKNRDPRKSLVALHHNIFEIWLQLSQSNHEKDLTIRFEEWVESKDYRDFICQYFGVINLDITNSVPHFGGGSSFSGMSKTPSLEELVSRYKNIQFPSSVLEKLNSPEVIAARKALGYIDNFSA